MAEREGGYFPDVDSRFKFCAFVASGTKRRTERARCGFFLGSKTDLSDPERCFTLTPSDFALVNPNTGTAPIFRTRHDATITTAVYKRVPVLVERDAKGDNVKSTWPVRYFTMFHMTNDSHLFWTRERLEAHRAYPVVNGRWQKGQQQFVPLYEGKMVQAFDHRAASVIVNPANLHRPGQPKPATLDEHQAFDWTPSPQFWVDLLTVRKESSASWSLGFKEITAVTNTRTMIAMIVPGVGFGNKLPLLLDSGGKSATHFAPFLVGNLNSFAYDFVARQKVHGQTLNLFIIEQLPVLAESAYLCKFGKRSAAEIVRDHVLQLSYTANDLRDFAGDMGHIDPGTGNVLPPFKWDEEERTHLRARLDALYFILYGIKDRKDVSYILETFPGVCADDVKAHGRYRTRDLILAYMNALESGDSEAKVVLSKAKAA